MVYWTNLFSISHSDIQCKCPLPSSNVLTSIHALILYPLDMKSNITVLTVTHTIWLVIKLELVKEMVPGQEVTHLVFKVCILPFINQTNIQSINCCIKGNYISSFISPPGCPCPSAPTNGYTSSCSVYHSYFDTIAYYCYSGYHLYGGSSRRSCQRNGSWSGSDPICVQREKL